MAGTILEFTPKETAEPVFKKTAAEKAELKRMRASFVDTYGRFTKKKSSPRIKTKAARKRRRLALQAKPTLS